MLAELPDEKKRLGRSWLLSRLQWALIKLSLGPKLGDGSQKPVRCPGWILGKSGLGSCWLSFLTTRRYRSWLLFMSQWGLCKPEVGKETAC